VLHFKTDCSLLDEETVFCTPRLAASGVFAGFRVILTPEGEDSAGETTEQDLEIPPEILVEAARAALPAGLIERLQAGRAARGAAGSGAGALRKSMTRGRPLPARPGRPGGPLRPRLATATATDPAIGNQPRPDNPVEPCDL
jgi:magnesium chelatase subunit D